MRGWRQVALLGVLALVASGCFRLEAITVIADDESGQLTITQLVGPEWQLLAEDELDFSDFDASMPDTAVLSDVTDGEYVGRRAVIPFTSLVQLNAAAAGALVGSEDGESELALFTAFAVTRDGSVFAFDAEYPELENVTSGDIEVEGGELAGTVLVSLQLPGVLTQHNADEVDGNLLTWRFSSDGPRTLTARSQTELVGGFTDVAGNRHADAILWVAEQGITTGFPDSTFRPGGTVTRGQMATFLTRALELAPGTATFSDVAAGSTHAASIAALADAEITKGFPDGTFRPGDTVTRGQMAAFLDRGLDLPPGTASFPDVVGTQHEQAIASLVEAKITAGFPDGTFRPNDTVTRGQMATFLFRALATD